AVAFRLFVSQTPPLVVATNATVGASGASEEGATAKAAIAPAVGLSWTLMATPVFLPRIAFGPRDCHWATLVGGVTVIASILRSPGGAKSSRRGTRTSGRVGFPLRFRRRVVLEMSGLARMAEPPWRIVDGVERRTQTTRHGRRPGTAGRAGRPIVA